MSATSLKIDINSAKFCQGGLKKEIFYWCKIFVNFFILLENIPTLVYNNIRMFMEACCNEIFECKRNLYQMEHNGQARIAIFER